MIARDADEILAAYPELTIVESRPDWMTGERFLSLARHDVDGEPAGLLLAILADRRS
jgi:hypothetical protein